MFSLDKISFGLFNDTKSYADAQKNLEAKIYPKLNLKDIVQVDFPEDQYYREQTKKKQIVIHHTVSGEGVDGDIAWWKQTAERIATSMVIGRDGVIYQCFSTLYWAHHIGAHASNNIQLNKYSIGVEIDSWGGLIEYQGKWYPAKWGVNAKKYIPMISRKPVQDVVYYPNGFKGYYAFERYYDEQIESLRKLLIYWGERYGIPLDYNEDMWSVSNNALSGKPGVWTHVSYRDDKSDCHPQPELITMLKSLGKK